LQKIETLFNQTDDGVSQLKTKTTQSKTMVAVIQRTEKVKIGSFVPQWTKINEYFQDDLFNRGLFDLSSNKTIVMHFVTELKRNKNGCLESFHEMIIPLRKTEDYAGQVTFEVTKTLEEKLSHFNTSQAGRIIANLEYFIHLCENEPDFMDLLKDADENADCGHVVTFSIILRLKPGKKDDYVGSWKPQFFNKRVELAKRGKLMVGNTQVTINVVRTNNTRTDDTRTKQEEREAKNQEEKRRKEAARKRMAENKLRKEQRAKKAQKKKRNVYG